MRFSGWFHNIKSPARLQFSHRLDSLPASFWFPCGRSSDSFVSGLLQFNFVDIRRLTCGSHCASRSSTWKTHTHTLLTWSGCYPVIHQPPLPPLSLGWNEQFMQKKKQKKSELQRMSRWNTKNSGRKEGWWEKERHGFALLSGKHMK